MIFQATFLAEDLSETSIQYKMEKVDFFESGRYRMMIIASDTYGNSIEKECIVRVQYEKETSSQNKSAENEEDQSVVSSGPYYVQGIMVVNKNMVYQLIMHRKKMQRQVQRFDS